jgi:hypothetical protein
MVWRQGDSQDSYDAQHADRAMPWRRAVAEAPENDPHEVVVEKWDDELPKRTKADDAADAARRVRANIGPTTLRFINLALFALAVIGAIAGLAIAWMHLLSDPLNDARPYYEAASRLNAGQPLYPANLDPNSNQIYLYPPLFAVLLRPFALLPYTWFALLWEVVVAASFGVLLQRLGVRKRSTWIAIGLLGVPIGWALSVAQAHVPMTLLMAIGQPWSVAIAANLKLFPALLGLYWLGRREWESAAAFFVWAALLALAQAVLAPGASIDYVRQLSTNQLGEAGVLRNFSPYTISPLLWFGLLFAGAALTIVAARYRLGWAFAVTFATLAPPRLLVYMLTSLLAGIRRPLEPGEKPDKDYSGPAETYRRATR